MISPTVNRALHYYPARSDAFPCWHGRPLAAVVTHVHGDRCVNLCVFDANGGTHGKTSVRLLHAGEEVPGDGGYCTWPALHGQAVRPEPPQTPAGTAAGGA